MPEKMDEDYFDEKKNLVCDGLANAIDDVQSSINLVKAWRYSMPGLTNPEQIHEMLRSSEHIIRNARRDFEKVRWAATKTDLQFEEWLKQGPGADICQP